MPAIPVGFGVDNIDVYLYERVENTVRGKYRRRKPNDIERKTPALRLARENEITYRCSGGGGEDRYEN